MFDKLTNGSAWHGGVYDTVAPFGFVSGAPGVNYNTSFGTFGSAIGDWVQIEMPTPIKLKKNYISSSNILTRSPTRGFIVASNDGVVFDILNTITDFGYVYTYQTKEYITETDKYYRIYRLIITNKIGGDGTVSMNMSEWRLFGTPAPSSLEDGHLTLGKALTAPRLSGHGAGAETPQVESLVVHYDTTVDSVVAGTSVVDTSGNGFNGTLTNGASYSAIERAFTVNGDGQYVRGTLPGTATGAWVHSVSCWFKRVAVVGSYDYIFQAGTATNSNQIAIIINSNKIRSSIYGGDVISTTTIANNQWYHVAVTYVGGAWNTTNVKIYINGVLETTTLNGAGTLNLTGTGLLLGYRTSAERLNGSISNFKLWGGVALTAEEVAAEYALGRTGKSMNVTDTSVCLGGRVPRAQLDVRGSALVGGNLGIGTAVPAYTLDVLGNIYASGNIIMYSDARLKENIKVIENALDKVCSISGYTFNKKGETVYNTGVLAQEVLRILPEVVHGSEETNYSVAYGNMVGILIEAIKELKAKNDALQDIVHRLANM